MSVYHLLRGFLLGKNAPQEIFEALDSLFDFTEEEAGGISLEKETQSHLPSDQEPEKSFRERIFHLNKNAKNGVATDPDNPPEEGMIWWTEGKHSWWIYPERRYSAEEKKDIFCRRVAGEKPKQLAMFYRTKVINMYQILTRIQNDEEKFPKLESEAKIYTNEVVDGWLELRKEKYTYKEITEMERDIFPTLSEGIVTQRCNARMAELYGVGKSMDDELPKCIDPEGERKFNFHES